MRAAIKKHMDKEGAKKTGKLAASDPKDVKKDTKKKGK
jgi:hypothetical protein